MTDGAVPDACDPDPDAVARALAGRPLVAPAGRTRGWCLRCQRKNDVRNALGLSPGRDPTFEDGDRVRLAAVAAPRPGGSTSAPRERRWRLVRASHVDHPERPRGAVARPDRTQARLVATVRAEGWVYRLDPDAPGASEYDPTALVLRDPAVRWVSPCGAGTVPDWADGDGPLDLAPTEPRPDWPAAENDWLRRVADRCDHGE